MPQCVVVCKQECNLSADIIVSPCTVTQVSVPINAAPQRCVTHEFLMFFYACGIENPTDFPLRVGGLSVGFSRFEMSAHKAFSICGYSFQNGLGFQRDSGSFGSGSSNRGESALLAGESKGDRVPLAVVSKGGSAALAGGIQRRAAPSVAGRIQ